MNKWILVFYNFDRFPDASRYNLTNKFDRRLFPTKSEEVNPIKPEICISKIKNFKNESIVVTASRCKTRQNYFSQNSLVKHEVGILLRFLCKVNDKFVSLCKRRPPIE